MSGQLPDEEERLARGALNRLTEPGDLRLSALVAEIGAVELHRLLVEERGPDGLRTVVAARLDCVDAERELERAARAGLRGRRSWSRRWCGCRLWRATSR